MTKPKERRVRRRIPPALIEADGVLEIPLTQGLTAWVDSADRELVEGHVWYAERHGHTFYACTHIGGAKVYLHDRIMNPPPGLEVDHISGVGTVCCRWNLRCVTHSENMKNSRRCVGGHCLRRMLEHEVSTPEERNARWQEIEAEIQAIHAGKVVDGDPAEVEGRLLQEQDEIEYLEGLRQFAERDGSEPPATK